MAYVYFCKKNIRKHNEQSTHITGHSAIIPIGLQTYRQHLYTLLKKRKRMK